MPFGSLTPEQERVLAGHVVGQAVHDLGAGDMALSGRLVQLGASHVTAIDKGSLRNRVSPDPRITLVAGNFADYEGAPEVAFVSWPANRPDAGLLRLLERSPKVIYLGKNTDGTQCGTREVFEHLSGREVLAYVPCRANTLLVYGPSRVTRKPHGEEWAAMNLDHIVPYGDALTGSARHVG